MAGITVIAVLVAVLSLHAPSVQGGIVTVLESSFLYGCHDALCALLLSWQVSVTLDGLGCSNGYRFPMVYC